MIYRYQNVSFSRKSQEKHEKRYPAEMRENIALLEVPDTCQVLTIDVRAVLTIKQILRVLRVHVHVQL